MLGQHTNEIMIFVSVMIKYEVFRDKVTCCSIKNGLAGGFQIFL